MSYHVVSNRQLFTITLVNAMFLAVCVWLATAVTAYLELPQVWISTTGSCVKVVNFKNGDGYSCTDKDVILRKYRTLVEK